MQSQGGGEREQQRCGCRYGASRWKESLVLVLKNQYDQRDAAVACSFEIIVLYSVVLISRVLAPQV